jgi:putative membrane protein
MNALFAFLHHLAAFVLFATVFMELVLVKGALTNWSARKILQYDLIYGVAAMVVIAVGILRVVYFEKGAAYYLHSIPFIVKMSSFALVGLLSIYPTMQFMKWRAPLKRGETPVLDPALGKRIARVIHLELAGLAIVILCAALMAKGVGYFG